MPVLEVNTVPVSKATLVAVTGMKVEVGVSREIYIRPPLPSEELCISPFRHVTIPTTLTLTQTLTSVIRSQCLSLSMSEWRAPPRHFLAIGNARYPWLPIDYYITHKGRLHHFSACLKLVLPNVHDKTAQLFSTRPVSHRRAVDSLAT